MREWNIKSLVDDAINLLEDVGRYESEEVTVIRHAESASMSMHLIDGEYIVALIDDTDDPEDEAAAENAVDGLTASSRATSSPPPPTQTQALDEQLRATLSSLRFSLAPSVEALPKLDFRSTATPTPLARRNAHDHTRQRRKDQSTASSTSASSKKKAALATWVGEVLCAMYETKRSITIDALVSSQLTSRPMNAFQAAAIIRVWERDAALECIDALWSDFLQDVGVLQQASQGRAFSMFDPVDEFRLESAKAFSSLLRRYSAIVSSRLLGKVEIDHVRYLENSSGGIGSRFAQEDANLDFVLDLANK